MLAEAHGGRQLQRVGKTGGIGAFEDMVRDEAVRAVEHVLGVHMRLHASCVLERGKEEPWKAQTVPRL